MKSLEFDKIFMKMSEMVMNELAGEGRYLEKKISSCSQLRTCVPQIHVFEAHGIGLPAHVWLSRRILLLPADAAELPFPPTCRAGTPLPRPSGVAGDPRRRFEVPTQ
jgi:hypothetical protein